MSNSERRKGVEGERQVARLYDLPGITTHGLEGRGDHAIVCGAGGAIVLHSETKRQEVARPWLWFEQATSEADAGATPVVHFRRNRSPWLALLEATELARFVMLAAWALDNGYTEAPPA
jgi:hypothetical protein